MLDLVFLVALVALAVGLMGTHLREKRLAGRRR